MIVIDGQQTEHAITNFTNLDQLLVKVMEDEAPEGRIVTDVFVNDEAFSEIYPHQAEDIETAEIDSVEIRTMGTTEMAWNISEELFKVVKIMEVGSEEISTLFRQADDAEALEMYQDLLDVVRNFISMVGILRDEFTVEDPTGLEAATEELSELFTEMMEVTENEDWILLADLLEYEFNPAVKRWEAVLSALREDIGKLRSSQAA